MDNNENHYQKLKRLYSKAISDLNTMIRRYKKLEKEYKKLKNERDKLKRNNVKLKVNLTKNKGS